MYTIVIYSFILFYLQGGEHMEIDVDGEQSREDDEMSDSSHAGRRAGVEVCRLLFKILHGMGMKKKYLCYLQVRF